MSQAQIFNYFNKKTLYFKPLINSATIITRRMLPLILSWAVTIQKVQGLTLDKAVIDLDCFDHHMEYVALSRLKTLDGLAICSLKLARFFNGKMIYKPALDQITPKK
jgi:ATP-dependent exoDNAse (exonuclease V) alpha subunit